MKIKRVVKVNRIAEDPFTKFMEDFDLTLTISDESVCEIDYVRVEIKELNVHELGITEAEAIANLINLIEDKVLYLDDGEIIKVPVFEAEKDEGWKKSRTK